MTELSLEDLLAAIERDLPGWSWLVRTDEEQGFMANIMTPDFQNFTEYSGGKWLHAGDGESFASFHSNLLTALSMSYEKAMDS